MVSVIRLDSDEVQKWCDAGNQDVDEDNKVQIASYLCPGNSAVSGGVKGVEAVEAKAKPFKDRMTAIYFLKIFMEPAVSRLDPVSSNLQVTSPVQGEKTVTTLLAKGLKKSYELGPGKVIAGIVKRMDKKAETENSGA
ncbi:hypothetical protein OIU74_001383 [Salix koriyanagi]|uniref:Uncharacterized protein n=1 Tax=Salix koriyanagi TaxID=2511006 RepID=A0A9Q1AMZ5_9ROSI|nr:hypothetical protein OIU74_001383 [Salix koriyanagi]